MEEEFWIKRLRERLEDYQAPLPDNGWNRLEDSLRARSLTRSRVKNKYTIRLWSIVAAAVVLFFAAIISLTVINKDAIHQLPNADIDQSLMSQISPAETDLYPISKEEENRPKKKSTLAVESNRKELLAKRDGDTTGICLHKIASAVASSAADTKDFKKEEKQQKTQNYRQKVEKQSAHAAFSSAEEKRGKEWISQNQHTSKKWSLGFLVGNSGGAAINNASTNLLQGSFANVMNGTLDLAATTDDILAVPEGQEMIFKTNVPNVQRYFREISNISHKQPIKVGISVRRNLSRGFSVETGITYAYLSSEIEYEDAALNIDQKLHYLGVPIRLSWNFLELDKFVCYVSAGGAIEKCIYGTIGNEKISAKPLQFSLLGLVGAQYNLSTHMGVYVEPGVSYYFDDNSDLQTFYKERPCNFTLYAGIRLTY